MLRMFATIHESGKLITDLFKNSVVRIVDLGNLLNEINDKIPKSSNLRFELHKLNYGGEIFYGICKVGTLVDYQAIWNRLKKHLVCKFATERVVRNGHDYLFMISGVRGISKNKDYLRKKLALSVEITQLTAEKKTSKRARL